MMRITLPRIFARTRPVACVLLLALVAVAVTPQQLATAQSGRQPKENKSAQPTVAATTAPLLRRTTTRREVYRLGFGGSVTIDGAPEGSVTVEGWSRGEVELVAEVEQSADTEENLSRLAALNTFVVDEDLNHLRVMTVGLHDRKYAKRAARDLPKNLPSMPWKIDYHLKVPAAVDLEINAGRGALTVNGVEGALRVNAGGGGASLFTLTGGDVEATLTSGPVTVRVPARNWRGQGMSLRVATGDLNVELLAGFSGDLDAQVLRTGRIENNFAGLTPRERTKPTDRSLEGRAGQGGAHLSFTVGDGTLRISQVSSKQ
ncbi:MAG: hypothetical protein QOJ70_1889 [Acidobacteriota bacterium]|nr:hypothetical protein [Acidobacteriota bacterium]